jgi:YfiH family protein
MIYYSHGDIRYFRFEQFDNELIQAIFTRRGGISPSPWASLNLGGTVGDSPERVRKNLKLALTALNCSQESVYDVWQVHGINVAIVKAPRLVDKPHVQADAILTNRPGITLMMRFADCVPIMFHDPIKKVAGLAHAGWQGTVNGMVRFVVEAMQKQFGSKPEDIIAGIGPSIGPDHYEIGSNVITQVKKMFGRDSSNLLHNNTGSINFDLWTANNLLLEETGVRQSETAGICTACHLDDWYSHRAEKGRTGRFGAIIALK